MNDQKDKSWRLSITFMFTGLVFTALLLTMILVSIIIYILDIMGKIQLEESSIGIWSIILIIALTSIAIGTFLSATAGNLPLRSVNNIINAINRLGAGDFTARYHIKGPFGKMPALVELQDSFNRMASELQKTEMLRGDFVNNFSHEFKTPIVSIAGFAKLLRSGNVTDEERDEYLGIIEDESMRLSDMATKVLELTKVENQEILTDVSSFSLSEQIRECVLLLESKWTEKELELNIDFDEYTIEASRKLLEEVWINLIDNAVKFTPKGGLVEIEINERGKNYEIRVIDSGSPIAEENLERVFRKFYQEDESHSEKGNGIGLAIVKKIVELHKGTVTAGSMDDYTVFTVTLPKKQ